MMSLFRGLMASAVSKGLVLALGLSVVAMVSAPYLGQAVSPLLLAIVIGLVLGNTLYPKWQAHTSAGIEIAKKQVLRTAIVLYGFRLTFSDIAAVGGAALLIDAIMVFATFFLTIYLGRRWFEVDRESTVLIGAGASICGAAAVLAAEPVVKAPAHKVSVAVATVVLFGTVAMFLYPLIYTLGILPINGAEFGIYIGSTVHEVAQVVAAGGVISDAVADTAVITKMTRVMMLAPFLLMLSVMMRRQGQGKQVKIGLPWFAVGFVLVVALHSLPIWPPILVEGLVLIDTVLLSMAMAALGLTTNFSAMKQVGLAPFKLGAAILLWLIVGGALINMAVFSLFSLF